MPSRPWLPLVVGCVLAGCGGHDRVVLAPTTHLPDAALAADARVLRARLAPLHADPEVRVDGGRLVSSVRPEDALLLRGRVRVLDWDRAVIDHACATPAEARGEARTVPGAFVVRASAPDTCSLAVRPRVLAAHVLATAVRGDAAVLRFAPAEARRWRRIEHLGVVVDLRLLGVVHGGRDGSLAVPADDPDALAAALRTPPLRAAYRVG